MDIDLCALVLLVTTVWWYGRILLPWQETRQDLVPLNDLVLEVLPRVDLSVPIALLHWFGMLLFFGLYNEWDPNEVMFAFTVAIWVRSLVLVLHPFDAPRKCIPLRDPIVEWFIGTQNAPLTRDLSIGGHNLMTVTCGVILGGRFTHAYYMLALLEGLMLMITRAHYTADIILSMLVAPSAYELSRLVYAYVKL